MTRKITLRGSNARYVERKAAGTPGDDREILMEGDHVRYDERTDAAQQPEAADGNYEARAAAGVLATDVASAYWQRLRDAGFVDDNYMLLTTTTRQQTWYIAELFAEKLQLKGVKWKPFQELWNIRNLAQEKKHSQDTGQLPSRYKDIDKIFQD